MAINRVIISGGGTGGHIFPAISIADEIKRRNPKSKILFVGAQGKMEMEKVPLAGYKIKGLPIAGFKRKLSFSNFLLPFKILKSLLKARKIIKNFKPQLVIGVGGYASGPTLKMANLMRVPTIIQEQNSFPGKTNRMLAKGASAICVAYKSSSNYFPKEKLVLTGNPVRANIINQSFTKSEAYEHFKLDPNKKTILVIGGSLGAKSLNLSIKRNLNKLNIPNIQVLWQCGKLYHSPMSRELNHHKNENIFLHQFISKMDYAYSVADIIVSRAGAISVSELCIIGKPVILVPSPNVTDDHQTKNALELVENEAAILVKDTEAREKLVGTCIDLINDDKLINKLSSQISGLAIVDSAKRIVDVCEDNAKK